MWTLHLPQSNSSISPSNSLSICLLHPWSLLIIVAYICTESSLLYTYLHVQRWALGIGSLCSSLSMLSKTLILPLSSCRALLCQCHSRDGTLCHFPLHFGISTAIVIVLELFKQSYCWEFICAVPLLSIESVIS